jgi:hypothetical protein
LKKSLLLTVSVLLIAGVAIAAIVASDDFSYPDGSLVGNGTWFNHSGNAGDLLVSGGQAVVTHGAPSEDVNLPFLATAGPNVFFSFDFSVDDLGAPYSGSDFEYFAHFKDDGFGFRGRMDVQAPNGAGDYTVGISSIGSTADAIYPIDLTYGVTYNVIVQYDQTGNFAQLWIDASTDTDLSIIGTDQPDPGTIITGFALRQSDSDMNETVRVDNLVISDDCASVFPSGCGPVAVEGESWGSVKSMFR